MSGRGHTGVKLTPVMQQYLEIKSGHEDAILFFRMGDFYEMFFEDAEEAAALLDIALTSRNRNDENPIPMCGVPHHSSRTYIARLLEAGRRVAMCEQTELPQKGAGIARREVTRVISPGTTLDDETLAPERSNYLAAVASDAAGWGLAVTDFSTGEVHATVSEDIAGLQEELVAFGPAEVVVSRSECEQHLEALRATLPGCLVEPFHVDVDSGSSANATDSAGSAAHRLLSAYVARTQGGASSHLRPPQVYSSEGFLQLDAATRTNLEILQGAGGSEVGSLVSVLDGSVTPMGKRRVRRWLVRPLADRDAIATRLDAVDSLVCDYELRSRVRELLRGIGDFERLAAKLGAGAAGPRDVVRLADALELVEEVSMTIAAATSAKAALAPALDGIDAAGAAREQIRATLAESSPLAANRGGLVRDGFHEEVDRLRSISRDGKGWIAAFETAERTRTGIKGLKVGFNKVFGYFVEITHAHRDAVPDGYIRKQTLANAERYVTEELNVREAEVLGAEERLASLEEHLFAELCTELSAWQESFGRTAEALVWLDAVAGLGHTAHRCGYVRPVFQAGEDLCIRGGRHPVVEAKVGDRFVANDCELSDDTRRLMVITGPNMAGKSTYLRQVALIVLMAHCGSFVPASEATIPLVDRIFTRIGASDDLAGGRSTFMVEMSETATILSQMTPSSLVVLDEIGRGTSTFDGISIAWAVAEAMSAGQVKTLFATHYHELASLAAQNETVENFSVTVRRYKGEILFLYRIAAGPTSGSYGIEVARLAGVPDPVIDRARVLLARFEAGDGPGMADSGQLGLFSPPPSAPVGADEKAAVVSRLASIDAEQMTPMQALALLAELVEQARKLS